MGRNRRRTGKGWGEDDWGKRGRMVGRAAPLVFNKSCTDKEGGGSGTEEGEKGEGRAERARGEWEEVWEEKVEEKEGGRVCGRSRVCT